MGGAVGDPRRTGQHHVESYGTASQTPSICRGLGRAGHDRFDALQHKRRERHHNLHGAGCAGWFVRHRRRYSGADGQVVFRAHKVYGWDNYKKVYTFHFFDSDGANPPARAEGTWEGDLLKLEQKTPLGLVRYLYTFENDNEYVFRMDVSEDGQHWSQFIEGRYQRVRAA